MAKDKNKDISFDAVDVGQHIVDGVSSERVPFDAANWSIVTQCDKLDGKRLKVGVIKRDEFAAISRAGQGKPIATNQLSYLLNCPK